MAAFSEYMNFMYKYYFDWMHWNLFIFCAKISSVEYFFLFSQLITEQSRLKYKTFFVKNNNQIFKTMNKVYSQCLDGYCRLAENTQKAQKVGIFEKSSVWVSVRAGIHKMSFIAQPMGLKYFSVLFFGILTVVPPIFCRLLITND